MTFEQHVERQIVDLRDRPWPALERAVAARRLAWADAHRQRFTGTSAPTPRQAFDLLFLDYMGLDARDLPIVAESDDEIVWESRNPCPTVEACRALGLDTRKVCRAVYEKSTQALVSRLDPRLRFLRDYTRIRPHADHCRERIVRLDFDELMGMALEEARLSRAGGNKGYGAVVALGRDVVARAHDTAATEGDPSLHAEVNAIRAAVRRLGDANLGGCVLVSTCEPCPMCASLAVWASVSAVVFGASIAETMALGRTRIDLGCEEIIAKSPVIMEVIGGVRAEECLALYA
ncbi:nucleoside deaminase [Shumkonia mesophila]|uniref:nucleoside deaminase n=1 Tax=Shumkonia mesophila TaxID=2838854 RepID=UPI0029347A1E|nr:nucleoside deaminase [Shumkonia mesophila]